MSPRPHPKEVRGGITLIYEVSPGENNFTCLICDGSGQIKNDVPLKDALIETIKGLAETE